MRSGRREICGDFRSILREFEPVTYIYIALQQEISSALQGQSASQASLHHFHCHIRLLHRIAASADDRALRSRKKFSAISFSTGFRHMISHVKSPTDHISRTFLIHGSIHTMHLPCGHTLPWRRSLRDGSRRYPLSRGSPSPYRQRCRLLSSHW